MTEALATVKKIREASTDEPESWLTILETTKNML